MKSKFANLICYSSLKSKIVNAKKSKITQNHAGNIFNVVICMLHLDHFHRKCIGKAVAHVWSQISSRFGDARSSSEGE